jgi:GNAT superfamily N-acetyltransferase
MSLALRPATAADLEALVALDSYAADHPTRPGGIATWLAAGQCHVAIRDDHVAGYAARTRSFFDSEFIALVMVAGSARRTGVGLALVAQLVATAPAGEKVWTSTNRSNRPMRALLAKAGFVPSGVIDNLDPGDPKMIFVHLPHAAA